MCSRPYLRFFVSVTKKIDHIVKWRENVTKRYMRFSLGKGTSKHTCAYRKKNYVNTVGRNSVSNGLFRDDKWFRWEYRLFLFYVASESIEECYEKLINSWNGGLKARKAVHFTHSTWDHKNRNQFTDFNWQEILRVEWKRNDLKSFRTEIFTALFQIHFSWHLFLLIL